MVVDFPCYVHCLHAAETLSQASCRTIKRNPCARRIRLRVATAFSKLLSVSSRAMKRNLSVKGGQTWIIVRQLN
jgi:hypothetical protein